MRRFRLRRMAAVPVLAVLLCSSASDGGRPGETVPRGGSRWGADYFPNIPLVTHEGKSVRFFDDLVKDKVVAINFFFTSCPAACPLETARLATVQRLLGDRVGRDVFFYSITIDPARDTPAVLQAYAERFHAGPGWTFLTGDEADIALLRRKLGVFDDDLETTKGARNHNLSLVIGNQATGRWMKSSPFENAHVLASQLGSWLHNWKQPDPAQESYADAPRLRTPSTGEMLFRTRCSACHTLGGGERVVSAAEQPLGPDLLGVTRKRDRTWLARWLADPSAMLAAQDPVATALYAEYDNVLMPNLRLNEREVISLIDYLDAEDRRMSAAVNRRQMREPRGW